MTGSNSGGLRGRTAVKLVMTWVIMTKKKKDDANSCNGYLADRWAVLIDLL